MEKHKEKSNMLILVIDDEFEVRRMIVKMLKPEGYEVIEAADGESGMDVIKALKRIDILITDLIMPEREGIEVIQEVKKLFPDIKIIAISGGGRGARNYLAIAKAMGAHKVLKKPFVRNDLLELIKQL